MGLLRSLCLVLICLGCSSKPSNEMGFQTRVYDSGYDEVWQATLKVLNDYPIKLNNKDTGRIQTEVINGPYNDLLFTPIEAIELPERFRYSIQFSLAKLSEDEPSDKTMGVRIRIIKDLEKFHDFYTGWLAYPSDGLEEKLILYRIEHLLRMEKKIQSSSAEEKESGEQDRAE